MSKKIVKESQIKLTVGLDASNNTQSIHWYAEDSPDVSKTTQCKAMLLSLFDKDHKDTLKLDLWTPEMQINEMDKFMYQTLKALADTYFKATKNRDLANEMQKFVMYFGEKTEVLPK